MEPWRDLLDTPRSEKHRCASKVITTHTKSFIFSNHFFSFVSSTTFYCKPKRLMVVFTEQYFPGSSSPLLFIKLLWLPVLTVDAQRVSRLPMLTRKVAVSGAGPWSFPRVCCRSICPQSPSSRGRCPQLNTESPGPAITCSFLAVPFHKDSGTSPWESGGIQAKVPC